MEGDLTKKFIEVKPYPWLEKLKKMLKKLPQKSTRDLTAIYRGKTTEKVPYIRNGGVYEIDNLWPRPQKTK